MDYYSRQRTVPDWCQPLIESQACLVLGVGGIGCSIARELCRLGVCRIVVMDNDVVAASNINRQVLYSVQDVGRRKVDAAVDGLRRDYIRTEVTAEHCDAVKDWAKIVRLARDVTVIFNCIDYGEYFDCAVSSLCVSLGLSYATASSYGHTAIAECYPPVDYPQKGTCWVCNNTPARSDVVDKITPDKITQLSELLFLPKDSYMPTTQDVGSSILSCTTAATLATGAWLNSLHGYDIPNWLSCNLATFEMFSYQTEPNNQCVICARAPRYSLAVMDIYFGSEVVRLSSAAGNATQFYPGLITNPATPVQYRAAKERQHSVFEESNKRFFLPAIPAAQLELGLPPPPVDSHTLPPILMSPLIKTEDGQLTAVRSGGRSCILRLTEGCYRLKGCGNYVDAEGLRHTYPGFPIVKMRAMEDGFEINGCCFRHTALTEQYISNLVGELLLESDLMVGNRPVGIWKYDIPDEPTAFVDKFCGLFETLGERRVGSHLIPGLEILVPLMFPSITEEEVNALFPEGRLVPSSANQQGSKVKPTWSACCSGSERSSPVDLYMKHLPETPPSNSPPKDIPPQLLGAWSQSAYVLRQSLPLRVVDTPPVGSLMAWVCHQVGYEMGCVKRILETHRINWGYFLDHNQFEPHCNSHPNNFIILPPGYKCLVAPVDFDLSFLESNFFSPYTGSQDPDLFESWIMSENVELERGIGGETVNTGLTVHPLSEGMSPAHEGLCWAFRDTLLLGYRAGYVGGSDRVKHPNQLKRSVEALIRMALILTHSHTS